MYIMWGMSFLHNFDLAWIRHHSSTRKCVYQIENFVHSNMTLFPSKCSLKFLEDNIQVFLVLALIFRNMMTSSIYVLTNHRPLITVSMKWAGGTSQAKGIRVNWYSPIPGPGQNAVFSVFCIYWKLPVS